MHHARSTGNLARPTLPEFPQRELSTLKTMARHLASLREDAEVVAAAQRLEKAAALFEELRKPILEGHGIYCVTEKRQRKKPKCQ